MALSTDKEQSNAQVNVHDQYSVMVHNAELKQDITVSDNSSFKSASVKKETFSSSTDTACISYNLRPRNKSRELSRLFSSNHDSRNTHSLSCRPVQYLNSSEVSDVKQKLAIPNDNFSIQLSSVEAETGRVTASCRSSNFHAECDMNAHSCNLAPVEYFGNSEIVCVKDEILDCEEGHDVECSKEEMLSVSNVSCVSYVFQTRNDDASSSKLVDSLHREDTKISDASETFESDTVDSGVTKQPSTYKIIASRSYGLRSGIQYREGRDDYIEGNSDNDKNNKNLKYCKKISSYCLRPRNTKTGKFTSRGKETCLSSYSLTGHIVHTKQALKNGGGEVGNRTSVSTVGMSCGGRDLRPRNNQGGGLTCKEHSRFCLSGFDGQRKSANIYDDQVKQTSIYGADIVSGPNSRYEEKGLYNLRPIGVPVRQGTMTHGDCTQIKHEILVSSTDVSSETYNLRPRNRQGRYSKPLSLQHREDTVMCSFGLDYNHKLISAEDIKQEKPSCDVESVSLSYAVCSRTHFPEMDNMYVNLEVKGETDNDENDALKCSQGRSAYNIQHHSRNYLSHRGKSDLSRNNYIKPEVVTTEDIVPRIPTACSKAHGQRLIIENSADVGSSLHLVTDVTSSGRNIPYYLRSRIVKDILDQDLPLRKEIKKERIQVKTVEIPKTPLSSYGEAIPVDNFKSMNTRFCEQNAFGNKGDDPCNIDSSVGITEVQNLNAGVGSCMHIVTDASSSHRNIPYYLRSHSIVKDVLDQDLPFGKEIKKEGIQTKTVEILKTPLSSYGEAITVDNFKNMNTRLCEQDAVGNEGDGPCSIDNSVGITEVQNFGAGVSSSMHMVTDITSSDRNIPYYLQSHIVEDVLDQDLPFRKEIKEGIQTKTAEIPKTPLSSYGEAITVDSFKSMSTRLCEQDVVGNEGEGPCSIDNSVGITEVQNFGACVSSSMHMVTDITLSDRNIPYYLQSHIVEDILDQDLPFRKEIMKEGIQTKTAEIPKTPLSSYGEAIPVDSFRNMNTRLCEEDAFENKGDDPCSTDNSVGITEVQNLEDVPIMNDGSKFNCSKESFCEELKQEMTGTYGGRIASLQEMRSVSHINENNFGGATCLESGRQFATAAERNASNENHCIFHNITSKPQLLQNCQSHSSCIGQDELQVLGDEKDDEGMEFLESSIVEPCSGSGLQMCEKSNLCTEEISYEMASASGLRGSENNGPTANKGVQIHVVEHPGTRDDAVCDMASKIGIQVCSPSNAAGTSHTKEEKLNEKGQFRRELLKDLSCYEDRSKTIGTSQHTKIFPHNKTAFTQNVSLTWQQEITYDDSSIHNEQGLIPASNADMISDQVLLHTDKNNGIREQKLVCVDNTGSANEENAVEIMTRKLSLCSLTKGLLNTGNECKGNDLIHGTDDSLTGVNFDVSGPNTIEISAARKSDNDSEKIHLSIPPEVIFPGIDDALTAEDFNVNGPNTVKISAPGDSFFTLDDKGRIFLDNDLQSRNDSDIDKMEFCMSVQIPKLSPGGSSVPKLVVQGMFKCTMQFLVLVLFFMLLEQKCLQPY